MKTPTCKIFNKIFQAKRQKRDLSVPFEGGLLLLDALEVGELCVLIIGFPLLSEIQPRPYFLGITLNKNKLWGQTYRSLAESEIRKLDVSVGVQKDVVGFQVSMDVIHLVDGINSKNLIGN